jgi:8-oxo-dGTP pyrophosphatase MutT (NUDIX family)/transcriptional regulator with XRE-family HTH domain
MSAQQLADRCSQLGMEIPRAVLANLENGRRATVSVAELLVLAEALQVPPLLLVVPLGRQELTEILPNAQTPAFEAARWWRGEGAWIEDPGDGLSAVSDMRKKNPVERVFEHQDLVARLIATRAATAITRPSATEDGNGWTKTIETHRSNLDNFEKRLRELRNEMRGDGLIPPPLPTELVYLDPPQISVAGSTQPQERQERQSVVAAIVTSSLGVLVGRRVDRTPPWGFISGEIEPGELPEDAAVREVKEETGLEVRAGQVIGERDHPATGRHMIYMAAEPTRGTEVFVGDEAELAEVRWVSLAEADELMGGQMFGPVREYLARAESHDDHGT